MVSIPLSAVWAQETATLATLHSFGGYSGSEPIGNLVQGSDGNFYGTTSAGGAAGDGGGGTVFRMTPAGGFTLLHSFSSGEGIAPQGGLVEGSDGNFYGTANEGGANNLGTIYQITPAGTLTVLHSFTGSDGEYPEGGLTLGSDGNFYGTAYEGGANGYGTFFQITLAGTLTTLYSFTNADGAYPTAGLVQGSSGNFYGTTYGNGVNPAGDSGSGTVYQITPAGAFTSLHTFTGSDGEYPQAGLVQGSDGNFYGTTSGSGIGSSDGTIFQITPAGAFTSLHTFTGSDGKYSQAGLVQGSDGNFYGTTAAGGANGNGTIFQLTPAGRFTILHSFTTSDGAAPLSALVQNSDGNFYGTTIVGGADGTGTFFELTVTTHPAFFADEAALGNGVYFLAFPGGNYFGFYSFLDDPNYLFHFDLGYEYVFDANDGNSGVYLYDFASSDFFYTSPGFPFPYLYDFNLKTVVYYYPDASNPGHYTTKPRYFYNFDAGQIITK